ncbi:hypothetical protein BT63DRAFT_104735 [Microthyrium microscopicum]|uniref:Ubiquitin-like domain-containing protein n=1 Tax=Microthyrium microscopicum TaxID=703497 RepID=A0A6A6TZF2_9PEZI|nr:hypothetical protein BT63DRAFT_104735 [Microthyrium microscopicum]
MSFGFSVGDVLAVGKLIVDVTTCLKDSKGAKPEYQDLLRELECLQKALQHLNELRSTDSVSTNVDSIKYAALSCRRPLEQFLTRIRKYESSLGVWSKGNSVKTAAAKLKWGFGGWHEEVRRLQSYLNVHVATINILLVEHGLEKIDIASGKSEVNHQNVQESIEQTHAAVANVGNSVAGQGALVKGMNTMLGRLFDAISGEFRTSLKSLGDMVAKVCVSSQQTYSILVEIKSNLTGPDTRLSYFQPPVQVEDALGHKFLLPSEFEFDLLEVIIKHRFRTGPGSLEVKVGNYEVFDAKNSNHILVSTEKFIPGARVTMAVLVPATTLSDEVCPMPRCQSTISSEAPGGGRLCSECNVWFAPSKKKRKRVEELSDDSIPANESEETTSRMATFPRTSNAFTSRFPNYLNPLPCRQHLSPTLRLVLSNIRLSGSLTD